MSQGAITIADGSGAAVLAAINAANARFATMASGTARPSDIGTGELWRETDNPGGGVHSVWLYDGASDVLVGLLDTGAHTWTPVDTTTIRIQVFTGSGTYTPHANMVKCLIEAVGGGGGGGGVAGDGQAQSGGGGGAGGYSRKLCTAADIGASKTVTIGAAGTAGSAGNNAGGAGGDTSVGSLCIGKGGSGGGGGGTTTAGSAGAGGVAGTGDVAATGSPGAPGMYGVASAIISQSHSGGSSPFGGGGAGRTPSSSTLAGNAGTGYGSGGSGAASHNHGANAAGGAGRDGLVIITEICSK